MKYLALAFVLCSAALQAQLPNAYPIFEKDAVHEIKLTFPKEDWYEELVANYDGVRAENPYFPATLEWGNYKFENIGVRFKGNSSYNSSAATKKRPFRLKLNEFVKGQKIDGIGAFNLSNAWGDPSFVREKVYYEMAAALGLKVPRSNFAALYINGEYWGLYVLGEVVNSDFLKNHLGSKEDTGNMYKGNIGASFGYLGEDATAYKSVFEKQTNEEADDWTDLIAFTKLLNDTPTEQLKDKLETVLDVDSVLASLALDNATVNLDSYVGMGQNFNFYRRPSDGKWMWIPWDPSLAFGALSQGQTQQGMVELPLEWSNTGGNRGGGAMPGVPPVNPPNPNPNPNPIPGNPVGGAQQAGRPLATKLWSIPEFKERYRQIYFQLMERTMNPEKVLARMTQLREMIAPWVEKDTRKLVTQEQFNAAMTTPLATTVQTPGTPGTPGAPGGGGFGNAPGLNAMVAGRVEFVYKTLGAEPVGQYGLVSDKNTIELTRKLGTTAPTEKVTLTLNGTGTYSSYAVWGTTESGNWLTIASAGGVIPANGSASFTVTVNGNPAVGTYQGMVKVFNHGAMNGPIEIPVTLTVTP